MKRDSKKSLFGVNTVRRIIIYGVCILILGCAQCAFFPVLKICPATPDLIMGMLLAITLLDGPVSAAVAAIGAGFFIDAVGGAGLALSPLIYLLYVFTISVFSGKMLKSFFSFIILLLPTLIYRAAATYICFSLNIGALAPLGCFEKIILPEAISTALLCLPVYFIIKLCTRMLDNHSRFTF